MSPLRETIQPFLSLQTAVDPENHKCPTFVLQKALGRKLWQSMANGILTGFSPDSGAAARRLLQPGASTKWGNSKDTAKKKNKKKRLQGLKSAAPIIF